MASFRVLNLSDFHIAVRDQVFGFPDWKHKRDALGWREPFHPSSHDKTLARAVAKFAFQWSDRVDAILVTGDLATTGEAGDLDAACRYVSEPAAPAPLPHQWAWGPWLTPAGFPTLQGAEAPVLLLPGNHDRFDGWGKNAGGRNFDMVFQEHWNPIDGIQSVVLELEEEKLAIVMADLTLAENGHAEPGLAWAYLGQGRAYPSVVDSLREETLAQRERHRAVGVIWAVHFPAEFDGIEPVLRLVDEHLLVAAAREVGAAHIFCGHTHVARQYRLRGEPELTVYCAGTAMQFCAPPPNVNTIHPTEIVVEEGIIVSVNWSTWQWDGDNDNFRRPR